MSDDHEQTDDGRDGSGRFTAGNQAARGHGKPHAALVSKIRRATLEAATPEKAAALMDKLYELGMGGSVTAAREWLDRTQGTPVAADFTERLEALEALLAERT